MKRIFNGSGGRKAALILSLCLIFALAVGTTVALLVAHTNAVTNTFTAAKSGTHIEEVTEDGEKSSIQVENIGTATSYVRVKLVMNWVSDDDSKTISATPVNISVNYDKTNWFEQDGIYYYTTYGNRRITAVDLHREPLDGTALRRYPMLTAEDILVQNGGAGG